MTDDERRWVIENSKDWGKPGYFVLIPEWMTFDRAVELMKESGLK